MNISAGIIPGVTGRVASNGHGRDIQKVMVWRNFYYEKRWFNTPELAPVPDNKRV
jgi:hypothetical protein